MAVAALDCSRRPLEGRGDVRTDEHDFRSAVGYAAKWSTRCPALSRSSRILAASRSIVATGGGGGLLVASAARSAGCAGAAEFGDSQPSEISSSTLKT